MRPKRAIVLWLCSYLVTCPSALFCHSLAAASNGPVHESSGTDNAAPNYCKDIAPLLQKHCLDCHRQGQVAPFGLETYEQARKRASDISSVVADRVMPPWKAVPHFGLTLRGDRSLSSAEIATITQWADADAPEGNPADLPPQRQFVDGWSFGTPDLVLDTGADFAVPAVGRRRVSLLRGSD